MNSGDASSNVSACEPLSARAIAVAVASDKRRSQQLRRELARIARIAHALRDDVGPRDALEQRGRSIPVGAGVRPARGRTRHEIALAERLVRRERAALVRQRNAERAIRRVDVVGRCLEFRERFAPTPPAIRSARDTPPSAAPRLSSQAFVMRSTAAGGGSSAMKCRASFVHTCRAVAGFSARSRRMLSPCLTPSSP